MTKKELEKRKAELLKAIDEAENDEKLTELRSEVEALQKEEITEEEEIDERSLLRKTVENLECRSLDTSKIKEIKKPEKEERKVDEEKEVLEQRGADLKAGKKIKVELEERSTVVSSGDLLIPKKYKNTIDESFEGVSGLVDRLNTVPLEGGESYSVPFEVAYGEGNYTGENADYSETDPETDYVETGRAKITAYSEISKEGTLEDAKLIIEPSNKIDEITSAIDNIQTTGGRTNIDAGLQTAKAHFSTETTLNKYLILLTDGVPNNSVGTSLTYSGNTAKNTKATLKAIQDSGINIITVMTGVNSTYKPDPDGTSSAEAAGKTYKDLAEEIFGTQEKPTYGKFYYVLDESVENTITKDVYQDVSVVIENEIKDITVVDYFPLNIVENYDFEIFEEANIGTVTPTVDTENNSITWTIGTLEAGKTASFKYKLKLKEKFNEKIINVETPTNQKVDVEYTGTDSTNKKVTSDVTPSIMLKKDGTPDSKPEEPKDNSIAPNPIPQTGDNLAFVVLGIVVLAVGIVIYIKKR